jgi:hypothetical protein
MFSNLLDIVDESRTGTTSSWHIVVDEMKHSRFSILSWNMKPMTVPIFKAEVTEM